MQHGHVIPALLSPEASHCPAHAAICRMTSNAVKMKVSTQNCCRPLLENWLIVSSCTSTRSSPCICTCCLITAVLHKLYFTMLWQARSFALLPQVLRQQHHLSVPDVNRLYRVLHIYSLGFHQVMSEITSKAEDRQQLLSGVWKAFLQLWEEALQVQCASSGYASAFTDLVFCILLTTDTTR